jgi:hypothetical protein
MSKPHTKSSQGIVMIIMFFAFCLFGKCSGQSTVPDSTQFQYFAGTLMGANHDYKIERAGQRFTSTIALPESKPGVAPVLDSLLKVSGMPPTT